MLKELKNAKIYSMELIEKIKEAIALSKNREFKKAENIYLDILKANPNDSMVLSLLGFLYFGSHKFKKANKYLILSNKIKEDKNFLPYFVKINYYLENHDELIDSFDKITDIFSDPELIYMALFSCKRINDYQKELEISQKAYKKFPFDKYILYYLANANISLGNFKDGEKYCLKLIKQFPKYSKAWELLGLLNELLYGAEEEARNCYKKMVKLGDKSNGYMNLLISYGKTQSQRTRYYIKKTLEVSPNAQINFVTGAYYLTNKNFKKGYSHYVIPDIFNKRDEIWQKKFKRPWEGGTYKKETLFIFGDQGLGDQIQHARYLPFVAKKFKTIKIMFAKPLIPIMKRTFSNIPNLEIQEHKEPFPKYDKSVQLANVLYYLNMNFNHIPNPHGYLICDENKVNDFKKYFNTKNLKIGLCWEAGGKGIRDQIHRNLNISFFDDILKLKNIDFYSFQVKPIFDDYKKYKNIIDLKDNLKDFDDTAAALKNIDLLITIDTSIAHMAGALGVKTFLLLPYCSDWRWFKNTKTTEWYDSIQIFKQKQNDLEWNEVFERVLFELKNISK